MTKGNWLPSDMTERIRNHYAEQNQTTKAKIQKQAKADALATAKVRLAEETAAAAQTVDGGFDHMVAVREREHYRALVSNETAAHFTLVINGEAIYIAVVAKGDYLSITSSASLAIWPRAKSALELRPATRAVTLQAQEQVNG